MINIDTPDDNGTDDGMNEYRGLVKKALAFKDLVYSEAGLTVNIIDCVQVIQRQEFNSSISRLIHWSDELLSIAKNEK